MATLSPNMLLADRYRLVELLGSGGFGETWLAEDELLGMPVAIKVHDDADGRSCERCLHEARALARQTRNAGIVSIRDLVDADGMVLLVMEYLEGIDLSAYLAEHGTLTLEEALGLLSPIATALDAMHAQGLLHRDVSPDNIRLLPDGTACLVDFGSALDSAQGPTPTIAVKPGYAPPEQYATPDEQGPWTDTYALAATIYQCLTGRVPMDALQRTFHDQLPAASALGAATTSAADAALAHGLALDYHERTQSPGALVAELSLAAADAGTQAEPSSAAAQRLPQQPAEQQSPKQDVRPQAQEEAHTPAPSPIVAESSDVETGRKAATPSSTPRRKLDRRMVRSVVGIVAGALALVSVFIVLALMRPDQGGLVGGGSSQSSQVHYRDQTVDSATIKALHNSPAIKYVSFEGCNIAEDALPELAALPSLEHVSFGGCNVPTLDPLASCETLTAIGVSGMGIDGEVDFSAQFPTVTYLHFSNDQFVSDMSFLGRFPALEKLDLSPVAGVSDLEFLSLVPNLTSLDVSGIDLSGGKDSPITRCPNLTALYVDACGLDNLEVATSLPGLSTLSAQANHIASIEPLRSCPNLSLVKLAQNEIASIEPLSACPNLWYLEVYANQLTSLEGLADHKQLEELYADANHIDNADGLSGCVALRYLSLSHNAIPNLDSIAGADRLRRLDVSYNQLTSLDFCETLIKLEELGAAHNQISDTTKLATCARLQKLSLADNQITDVSALGNGFTSLQLCDLSTNDITSLEPLAGCVALEGLAVYDNQLTSLDGMGDKPKLEYLLADGNHIGDISALATSTGVLRALDLGNNEVTSVAVLSDLFSQSQYDVTVTLLLDHNRLTSVSDISTRPNYGLITLFGNPIESIDFLKREGMRWTGAFIPYVTDADYADLFMTQNMPAPLCIVGAPYDRQAQLLDDASNELFEPKFYTEEQADAMAAERRAELHARVSGSAETQLVDSESREG